MRLFLALFMSLVVLARYVFVSSLKDYSRVGNKFPQRPYECRQSSLKDYSKVNSKSPQRPYGSWQ